MRANKTIKVDIVKAIINEMLELDFYTPEQKSAMCIFIEGLLMGTGNYHGFQYIHWDKFGHSDWLKAGKPEGVAKDVYLYGAGTQFDRYYY